MKTRAAICDAVRRSAQVLMVLHWVKRLVQA